MYQFKCKRYNYIDNLIELYTYKYINEYLFDSLGNLLGPCFIYKYLKLYIYI